MTPHDRAPIEAIRRALRDPHDVARKLGLTVAQRQPGGGVTVCCPIHQERTGSCSLTVGPDGTLRVRCFGCGFRGDVLGFVAALRSLSLATDFRAVLAQASALALLPIPDDAPVHERPPTVADPVFAAIVDRLLNLCPLFPIGPVGTYLHGRGVLGQARRAGWGALPRRHLLPALARRLVDEFGEEALLGAGFACRDEHTGAPRITRPGACVLIPWRDATGRAVGLQRRRLDMGTPRYIASRGRPLATPYGLESMRGEGPVVYVEGAVDVLAMRELCGRRRFACDVLGLPGIEAWRASWAEHARGRASLIALDNEPEPTEEQRAALAAAGRKSTREVVEAKAAEMVRDLEAAGALRVKRWRPSAKDWADVLRAQSTSSAARSTAA